MLTKRKPLKVKNLLYKNISEIWKSSAAICESNFVLMLREIKDFLSFFQNRSRAYGPGEATTKMLKIRALRYRRPTTGE